MSARNWTLSLFALLLIFLGIQFVRPELKNPLVTSELQTPDNVKQILRNSCYNCHSNETKLPWFDRIVPAYWLVARDIKRGRMHLNFSDLRAKPAAKQKGLLFEAVNQIQLGAMPLPSYTRIHPEAVVTLAQLAILRAYLNPPQPLAPAAPAQVTNADAQYKEWLAADTSHRQIAPELNGVAFLPDYKNWKAISSTDRFDNHTMRVILGNDIAIKAIADHRINPWPNGSTFAKVSWFQQPGSNGLIRTGAFQQVELMIKDSGKYAATDGWGWGRWLGVDLKPYGTKSDFTGECMSCHEPVRKNDFVYTPPIDGQSKGESRD